MKKNISIPVLLFLAISLSFAASLQASRKEKSMSQYIVMVDSLRLRKSPDLQAEVIDTFPIETIVEFTGEKTHQKEKIVLRGFNFDRPWLQVIGPNGKKGWVYDGALARYYKMQKGKTVYEFYAYGDTFYYTVNKKLFEKKFKVYKEFYPDDISILDVGNYYCINVSNQYVFPEEPYSHCTYVFSVMDLQSNSMFFFDKFSDDIAWGDFSSNGKLILTHEYVNASYGTANTRIFDLEKKIIYQLEASRRGEWRGNVFEYWIVIDNTLEMYLKCLMTDKEEYLENKEEIDGLYVEFLNSLGIILQKKIWENGKVREIQEFKLSHDQ